MQLNTIILIFIVRSYIRCSKKKSIIFSFNFMQKFKASLNLFLDTLRIILAAEHQGLTDEYGH